MSSLPARNRFSFEGQRTVLNFKWLEEVRALRFHGGLSMVLEAKCSSANMADNALVFGFSYWFC